MHKGKLRFISASILTNRLSEFDPDPNGDKHMLNPQRRADWEMVTQKPYKNPFNVYTSNGGTVSVPKYFIDETEPYSDAASLHSWETFAGGLVTSNLDAGNNVVYGRFRLAPKSGSVDVFFTPPQTGALYGVTEDFLQAVIDKNQDKYGAWTMAALTYDDAQRQNLKIVSTNFMHLYHTWMQPSDYTDLWKRWNTSCLPLPFPEDNQVTRDMFENLPMLKTGKLPVEGFEIPLTTEKMQNTVGKRLMLSKKPEQIMGKSATEVFRFP